MKSLKSIVRKSEKKKARRKDFKKRLNINKNVPTVIVIEKKEKFKSIVTNGKQEYYPGTKTPRLAHIGFKSVKIKKPVFRRHKSNNIHKPLFNKDYTRQEGMIQYPEKRKFRKSKKATRRSKLFPTTYKFSN